jgi:hypothetical protein
MEEMSKKTKRLEKENLNLTRKQEATNKNIFQMAEERSQSQQTIDRLTRENEKLKKLCRAMQSGGYGGVAGNAAGRGAGGGAVSQPAQSEFDEEFREGETESEYDEDEYDEEDDEEEEEGEYEDETEEEAIEVRPRQFGPPPPPPPTEAKTQEGQGLPNGRPKGQDAQMNGTVVNGEKMEVHVV